MNNGSRIVDRDPVNPAGKLGYLDRRSLVLLPNALRTRGDSIGNGNRANHSG
jgi:hypothetical protein